MLAIGTDDARDIWINDDGSLILRDDADGSFGLRFVGAGIKFDKLSSARVAAPGVLEVKSAQGTASFVISLDPAVPMSQGDIDALGDALLGVPALDKPEAQALGEIMSYAWNNVEVLTVEEPAESRGDCGIYCYWWVWAHTSPSCHNALTRAGIAVGQLATCRVQPRICLGEAGRNYIDAVQDVWGSCTFMY